MPRIRAFEHYVTPDDRVDIRVKVESGDVVDFSANYRARIDDEWVEVVRYDTAHGHLHLHRFWRPEEDEVETLDARSRDGATEDYGPELEEAEEDLVENWRSYRKQMEDHVR